MRNKASKRGKMSVPSGVREKLHIGPGTNLKRGADCASARVTPMAQNLILAFRGSGKKELVKQLLKERRRDRQREPAARDSLRSPAE